MKKNNSLLLSTPYIIWMVVFTLIPLGVVGYYALTDLLGGMQIRIGDRVVDSSIQTKLNQLQKELLSLQV